MHLLHYTNKVDDQIDMRVQNEMFDLSNWLHYRIITHPKLS